MNDSTTTTTTTTTPATTTEDCGSTICNCMPGIGMNVNMNMNISTSDHSVFHGQALDIILVVNDRANAKKKSMSESCTFPTSTTTPQQQQQQTPIQACMDGNATSSTSTVQHDNQSGNHESNNLWPKSSDTTTPIPIACNDFNVSFPGRRGIVRVQVNGIYMDGLDMISLAKEECRFLHGHTKKPSLRALQLLQSSLSKQQHQQQGYPIRFHLVDSKTSSIVLGVAEATVFLWQSTDQILACDIDGTITKSNVRGAWDTIVTERYDHVHPGVAGFLQTLQQQQHQHHQQQQNTQQHSHQQLHIVYLTSRPMSLVTSTRKFLQTFEQQKQLQADDVTVSTTTKLARLPPGPVFCNLLDLGSVLMSELLWKDVYRFKSDVLTSQILLPFQMVGDDLVLSSAASSAAASTVCETKKQHERQTTLVMGFGNTTFDTMAYEMAGIPLECIYQINERGLIKCNDTSHAPVMMDSSERQPPKVYNCFEGSTFQGYTDPKLLDDVQRKLNQFC